MSEEMTIESPVSVETPTAPISTPVVAPAITAPTKDESYADRVEREENELNEDLGAIFRKVAEPKADDGEAPLRADDGKFAAKDVPAPGVEPAKDAPKEAPKVSAPRSWPKDMAEKFGALPPEVQSYVTQREAESHKAISTLGQQVKSLEPVQRVLAENRATFERNGTSYEQGLSALIAAQNALDQSPENGLAYLAKTYNVDLRALAAKVHGNQTDNNGFSPDPEVLQLRNQLANLERQIQYDRSQQTAQQRVATEQREAQVRSSFESQIDTFAKDKADFYDLAPDILPMLAVIQKSDPGLSAEQVLTQAYDRATWANPTTREVRLNSDAVRRLENAQKQATEAKRAGSINVRSAPKQADASDMDSDLKAIWRKANAR